MQTTQAGTIGAVVVGGTPIFRLGVDRCALVMVEGGNFGGIYDED